MACSSTGQASKQTITLKGSTDIVTEFFGYLGETMVVYRSNGTGGGGLFSLTGLIELSNPDGMKKTLWHDITFGN